MIYDTPIKINKTSETPRYDILDSHLHFLDFTQDSDGFPALVNAMDEAGVSEAVVFGMPMMKKWNYLMKEPPAYYMSDDSRCYYYSGTDYILANELLAQPEEVQKKFHPFCCGFDCTDKYAATQIERLLKMYPNFWQGIGELMSRHDDLTRRIVVADTHSGLPAVRSVADLGEYQFGIAARRLEADRQVQSRSEGDVDVGRHLKHGAVFERLLHHVVHAVVLVVIGGVNVVVYVGSIGAGVDLRLQVETAQILQSDEA